MRQRPEIYMQRCLELAARALGHVAPNPMVGAILVHENRIIGEGYHEKYGGPHAEVNCLMSVASSDKHLVSSATLFVSLEPCCHHGKTPPCTDLILDAGIKKLVIACADPFEKVNGGGIALLQQAGVEVVTGCLAAEAIELNKRFFTATVQKRPYIILKWAQSSNGKISSHHEPRKKISGSVTDQWVHRWRGEESGIMVGTQTALDDNPALTTRLWTGKNPVRISVDLHERFPDTLQILDQQASTIIFGKKNKTMGHVSFIALDPAIDFFTQWSQYLISIGIQSVIIEGGPTLQQAFIDAGLWDEARVITNTHLHIEAGKDAPMLKEYESTRIQELNEDMIQFFSNKSKKLNQVKKG